VLERLHGFSALLGWVNMKTTWILGAGFSRSLGGPLLQDFFSPSWRARIEAWKPNTKLSDEGEDLLEEHWSEIENLHSRYDWEAVERHRQPWRNAEEFLSLLDSAGSKDLDSGSRKAAKSVLQTREPDSGFLSEFQPKKARDAAILYLSIATDCFLDSLDGAKSLDRWLPYRRWVQQLQRGDAIIDFNYDQVVERAFAAEGKKEGLQKYLPIHGEKGASNQEKTLLYKLHGSVAWSKKSDTIVPHRSLNEVLNKELLPVIGMPGPDKGSSTSKLRRHFKSLWDAAMKEIRSSDKIIFVGYRFPQTDAGAKSQILDALENSSAKRVHLVLGPDISGQDMSRMLGMLGWCYKPNNIQQLAWGARYDLPGSRHIVVTPEPMWAEDFLGLYSPDAN